MELTERKERILSSVVSNFIKNGEPIGSKAIADEIGVSSATIRNEMAELISLGLLEQPHTSAGRIPSQKGIRHYLSGVKSKEKLSDKDIKYFDSHLLANSYDPETLIRCVSRVLPIYTGCAAVATTPNDGASLIRAVQFVQLSRRTAMLVLMGSSGTIKNRVFTCDYDLTPEILRMLFRIFNEKLRDVKISDINIAYIQTLSASFGDMAILSAPALIALLEAANETKVSEVIVSGQLNLIHYPELGYETVRNLVSFFERKEELALLLKQKSNKVAVLIGNEANIKELSDCSVIISRYSIEKHDAGGIAIIGPIRMDYQKLISVMEYLSVQIGEILTSLIQGA